MPLTKAKKAEQVENLSRELAGSTTAIVGTFAKLTVSQDFQLRKAVRGAGGSYRVVKNKLAARAAQGTGVEAALQGLKGVSSVAYTSGDPVALAKALSAWVKDNAEFTVKLGIVDGRVLTVAQIGELATMPSKEEIYAKLLFLINSPAQRLATVIAATGRDLAVVINQGVEKGKFAAPAVEAEATPVAEVAPGAPAAEVAPVAPAAEVAPAAPVAEVAPAAPVAEVAPAAPVAGAASTKPVVEVSSAEPVAAEAASSAESVAEGVPVAPVALAAVAAAAVAVAPVAVAAGVIAAAAAAVVAVAAGTAHPVAVPPKEPASEVASAAPEEPAAS